MSPRFVLNDPLMIIRRVTQLPDMTLDIDVAEEEFIGHIYRNTRSDTTPPGDSSVRQHMSSEHDTLWFRPDSGITINPGDRIDDAGTVFEALTGTRGKRAGERILVNEVHVTTFASLYPVLAQLTELGGGPSLAAIPVALWQESQNDNARGTYRSLRAEAPPEYYEALATTNRELRVGGRVHHIDQVDLSTSQPHVSLSLREKS
jgi:hypothetical protein